jgi:hypothetical protein
VQLADKLEAKQAMEKANWECWKILEEGFEQFHRLFLFDLVDDNQEVARQDERIRQRWTVNLSQHGQEMDMSPYSSPSPSPQQRGSRTKTSAQRKQKEKRRKRTGKTISLDVGSGEKLIKEEAKDGCARPHSGIRLFVINEVNKDSMEEDYKDEGSTDKDINKESNKSKEFFFGCARTGSGGFFVSLTNNDCKDGIGLMIEGSGLINPQALCGVDNNDGDKDYLQREACIGRDSLSLFPHVCMGFVYSTREIEDTIVVWFKSVVGSWERDANWILNIYMMIQGADLRRFDKHKQRATLGTGEYPPVMNCTLFCGIQGIQVWMGKHPLPSYAVHKWNCRIVIPNLV